MNCIDIQKPDVSIIIPVYNAELYLRDCIRSVINQTHNNIEIICVDDGSLDNSLIILKEFSRIDSRLRVIHKRNEGQSIARNLAISCATGRYIAFVDADDFIEPDLCSKAVECCDSCGSDLLIYDYNVVIDDVDGVHSKHNYISSLKYVDPNDKIKLLDLMGVVWTKFVRAEFLSNNSIYFPEGLIYEDILVHWELILCAEKVHLLPSRLYNYRVHSQATTLRKDWGTSDRLEILEQIRTFVTSKGLIDSFDNFLIQLELKTFFWFYDNIDNAIKNDALAEIKTRLNDRHTQYVYSENELDWKVRDFFKSLDGHLLSTLRRTLWLYSRAAYRRMISCLR